jgi:hypothetical protein
MTKTKKSPIIAARLDRTVLSGQDIEEIQVRNSQSATLNLLMKYGSSIFMSIPMRQACLLGHAWRRKNCGLSFKLWFMMSLYASVFERGSRMRSVDEGGDACCGKIFPQSTALRKAENRSARAIIEPMPCWRAIDLAVDLEGSRS